MKPYPYIISYLLGAQLAMDTAKEILTDMQFFCNTSVNAHGTQCFIFCAQAVDRASGRSPVAN